MVVEVTYLTWTDDNLLRHVVFNGVREDKPRETSFGPFLTPRRYRPGRNRKLARGRAEWLDLCRLCGHAGQAA